MRSLMVIATLLLASLGGCETAAPARPEAELVPVVFVCEHGNVKSLIGASLFDQVARERQLPFRAVSRGVSPESSVPPKIIDAMRADGFEVAAFQPQRLSSSDMARASRVIAIGVDISAFRDARSASIERWDDVPPASIDYAAAHAALLRHIHVLMDELTVER